MTSRAAYRFIPTALLLSLATACAPDPVSSQVDDLTEPAADIGDEEDWVVMQSHLHTTGMHKCSHNPLNPPPLPEGTCYTSEGIDAYLDAALDYGASDMIITDHNNIDSWFDRAFVPKASRDGSRYATPLRGTEWSSGAGHLTLFFPREVAASNREAHEQGFIWDETIHPADPTPEEYRALAESVHDSGGLVIINHPKLRFHPFEGATHGADGVEVGVMKKWGVQSTSATRNWWHQRLLSGDRVTAMAGADHHHGESDVPFLLEPTFGVAVNLIRVDRKLPNYQDVAEALNDPQGTIDRRSDISADAIRRGHVMVVEDLHTPRVYIGADLNHNGRFHNARGGDCVPADAIRGGKVRIRVRVRQPAGEGRRKKYNMLFYTHETQEQPWYARMHASRGFSHHEKFEIDPSDPFAVELELDVDPSEPGFIRVELELDRFGPNNKNKTVTNPIYFGEWGAECDNSKPLLGNR